MDRHGNQLSRYGAVSAMLPFLAPSSKALFVLSGTPTWFGDLGFEFPVDSEGGTRVFQTVSAAVAACTAGRGDIIYVMPNHTETIPDAITLNINVAGIRVIGLGTGNNRPTFTLNTATTAVITLSAANTSFENCIIDGTGFDAIAKMISVTAAGVLFQGNKFITGGATNQTTLGFLTTAAATDLKILDNEFFATSDAGTTSVVRLVGGSNIQIRRNSFIGGYSAGVGAIENITTDCVNLLVEGNFINNLTASSTKAMTFTSGTTGQISNNRMQILSGTAPITGAAMSWVGGNYYAATIATAGTLI